MSSSDAGKTCLIRAIEHVEAKMWVGGVDGIPTADPNKVDARDILRKLEMSIETSSFEWCCLPWSKVVAHEHQVLDQVFNS